MSELMTDGELNELLREKLLASDKADKLMDMQAEVIFAGKAAVTPPLLKEKELFSKLGAKAASKFSIGWIFTSLSAAAAIIITSVVFVMNSGAGENKKSVTAQRLKAVVENAGAGSENVMASDTKKTDAHKIPANPTSEVSGKNEFSALPKTPNKEVNCVAKAATSTTSVAPIPLLITTPVSETQTATPSVNPPRTIEDKTEDVAPVAPAKSPTPKTKVSSCRIWNTEDLCSTPDSLKFPYGIECDGCEYSDDCKAINGKKLTPVILRIYRKNGFRLENGFHSITLTTSRGAKLEPFAISIDRYMTNVKHLGVKFKNVVDMVLLFPQANPGDKVTIDGVVEAVIEK
jgi:hypothetical protein